MATSDDGEDGACFVPPTMLEFKLLEQSAEAALGTFSGYLAAYGNTDENEDRLMPGAFTASLAEYRRAGEMPPMFLNHAGIPWDAVTTESLLPIGVWTDITEDSRGLASKGRIDPMDTDLGKRIYAGLRNRTVKGLSIGYKAIGFTSNDVGHRTRGTGRQAQGRRQAATMDHGRFSRGGGLSRPASGAGDGGRDIPTAGRDISRRRLSGSSAGRRRAAVVAASRRFHRVGGDRRDRT